MKTSDTALLHPAHLFLAVLLLSLLACAPARSAPVARTGSNPPSSPPRLEDSFAVASIGNGQTWRVFVKGSDPDGDMKDLWVLVTQPGSRSENEFVTLKAIDRGAFSGYIAIDTPPALGNWETLKVEIRIRDQAGQRSELRTQEVTIGGPGGETVPDQWREASGKRLGTISFPLESTEEKLGTRPIFRRR